MSEKRVAALISNTLRYGVLCCALLLLTGMAATLAGLPAGKHLLRAGLLVLLLTPAARVVMLAAGYAREGNPRFAVMAAVILLTMLAAFFLG